MKNKKNFLITVDTEGDDQWRWKPGDPITTHNASYIPRFQELCESYGFKPVYLVNYEMAQDDRWVRYSSRKEKEGKCEIGMHLHGWNTPPSYKLPDRFGGNPYITEYPAEVIAQKVACMMDLLKQKYETEIISHRSGRWATNPVYFEVLAGNGIRIDCSVTPELDLSGIAGRSQNCGNDYTHAEKDVHYIHPKILEIPMTTRKVHHAADGSLKHRLRTLLLGDQMWLRPISKWPGHMQYLTRLVEHEKENEHLEFMIHSSELMPGGSTYFKDEQEIERMYQLLELYFSELTKRGYRGLTLKEFAQEWEEM